MITTTAAEAAGALLRITTGVSKLLALVETFRDEHPAGHACEVCDIIRRSDEVNAPAGPSDMLVALHVCLLNFDNLRREVATADLAEIVLAEGGVA